MATEKQILNSEDLAAVRSLRNRGYAIAMFSPKELGDCSSEHIEDVMIAAGNNTLSMYEGRR